MIEYRLYGKCEILEEVPPGAQVTAIDDAEVIARCEGCGEYILGEEDFGNCDQEGTYLCKTCWGQEQDNELDAQYFRYEDQ